MGTQRVFLADFALANPLYSGATVSIFTVDPKTLTNTNILAPVYGDLVSAVQIANPQTLDGEGKWQQPVYVDRPVILQVGQSGAADHETGIEGPIGTWRGDWATATLYFTGDEVRDGLAANDTSGVYRCAAPHTSGTFSADLATGYWNVYVDAAAVQAGVVANAIAAAQASATAAAASQTAAAASATSATASASAASASATSASGSATSASSSASAAAASVSPILKSLIYGLQISAPGGASVLSVSAGSCGDSTGASLITLGAFTKSVAGPWVAGSAANGMGTGVTFGPAGGISGGPWFAAFAITANGLADVYVDSSASAANAPAGTTASRRLGFVKSDGSSHILGLNQNGDEFLWAISVTDANGVTPPDTLAHLVSLTVPPGGKINARYRGRADYVSGSAGGIVLSSPDESDQTAPMSSLLYGAAATDAAAEFSTRTNTSGQIRVRTSTATMIYSIFTFGWLDTRGRLGP